MQTNQASIITSSCSTCSNLICAYEDLNNPTGDNDIWCCEYQLELEPEQLNLIFPNFEEIYQINNGAECQYYNKDLRELTIHLDYETENGYYEDENNHKLTPSIGAIAPEPYYPEYDDIPW